MQAGLCVGGHGAGFEHAFGNHQHGNQAQHKQGFGRMVMAVFGRDFVSFRLYDGAAVGGKPAGHQHHCGCVVFENIVDVSHDPVETGQDEAVGNADDDQRAGTNAQDQKSGENHDVDNPGLFVAGLPVLAQPQRKKILPEAVRQVSLVSSFHARKLLVIKNTFACFSTEIARTNHFSKQGGRPIFVSQFRIQVVHYPQ